MNTITFANQGAFTLMEAYGKLSVVEYTGYRDEILGSKTTAYLGTSLCDSPTYDVKGPDADKFLSSICVNDFSNVNVGSIRHAIICNEKGQIMTDGVVMKIAEDFYRTYWLQPVINFHLQKSGMNVQGEDISGTQFFYQLAGPKSLEILEHAGRCDFHDIAFAKHRLAEIAGCEVRILRLGMAGTLAYEIHGPIEKAEEVYTAIYEAGEAFGGVKKLGRTAYCMNHTEAGFPNIFIHFPMPWKEDPEFFEYLQENPAFGFFNLYRRLAGSVGNDVETRFKTPYDLGWGKLIKFNHDFIGKDALLALSQNHNTQLVTLEWNAEDVADVYASQFRGRDEEPYQEIDSPASLNFNPSYAGEPGVCHHADLVYCGENQVGTTSGRIHSVYYQRMISLGYIDAAYAQNGTELEVLWGDPGRRQKRIRARVANCPYIDVSRNQEIDVASIPRYVAKN